MLQLFLRPHIPGCVQNVINLLFIKHIKLTHFCSSDQGFIKMLVSQSPVQEEVKEGESLSLKVEFDAYPAPSFMSWSYNGKILHNTTEHVITLHRNKYRYSQLKVSTSSNQYASMSLWVKGFYKYTCSIRYSSKLRLVRVLGSEGGIYNFSASHKDASVDHSFHVYVNSKQLSHLFLWVVYLEHSQQLK